MWKIEILWAPILLVILTLSCSSNDVNVRQDTRNVVLNNYLEEALRFMRLSEYDSAKQQLRIADSLAISFGDKKAKSMVFAHNAWILRRTGDLKTALNFYEKAISIDRELNDTSALIPHLNQAARVLRELAMYSLAAEKLEETINLSIDWGDSATIATASNRMGNVLLELEERDKSIIYYDKALEIWKQSKNMVNYAIGLQNKADALFGIGELDESLSLMQKSSMVKDSLGRISSKAYTLTSLGRVYLLRDSVNRAKEVLEEAIDIRRKSSNKTSYAESLLILSRVSLAKKQYRKAETQLKEVEQIARDSNKADLLRDAFADQRALYKVWGKFRKLSEVDEVYDIMTDSLYREEKLKVQEAQSAAGLQREQQKTELAEQGTRLANLELDAESQRSQFRLILVIIAMMGLLVIAWQLLQIRKRNTALVTLNSRIKLITDNAFHSQKNALGLISALLRSKARQSNNEKELEVLKDVESKIDALGGVAKSLFQRRIEDNTAVAARVQLKPYLEELVDDTFSSVASRADLDLSVEDLEITSTEALNIGLITNEAITNFSKYAEPAGAEALIIRVTQEDTKLHLSFTDDGPGFPEGFDFSSSTGFGMQMMANLVDDMDGELSISREEELTQIDIYIPVKA